MSNVNEAYRLENMINDVQQSLKLRKEKQFNDPDAYSIFDVKMLEEELSLLSHQRILLENLSKSETFSTSKSKIQKNVKM